MVENTEFYSDQEFMSNFVKNDHSITGSKYQMTTLNYFLSTRGI